MESALNSNPDENAVLPLQSLLVLLRGKGLAIGPVECEQIRLLLSTQHRWCIEQIQTALRAIVARDASERLLFDVCFSDLFEGCIAAERSETRDVPTFDFHQALAEFANLQAVPPPPPPILPVLTDDDPLIGEEELTPSFWKRRPVVTAALFSVFGLVCWWLLQSPDSPDPPDSPVLSTTLSIVPALLDFGRLKEQEIKVEYVRIANDGAAPAEVSQVSFRGDQTHDFQLQSLADTQKFSIPAGEAHVIPIHFTRRSPGMSETQLTISVTGLSEPLTTLIRAERALPAPVEFVRPLGLRDPIIGERPEIVDVTWAEIELPSDVRPLYVLISVLTLVGVNALWWWRIHVRYRPPPDDEAAPWRLNEDGEEFSFRDIGGTPDPVVPLRAANRMGDLLGFFRTADLGQHLDLKESIHASIHTGFPSLRFESLIQTREVVILEDARAHPDFRSPLVDDLSAGLQRTGVTLHRCWFDGRVDVVRNQRGGTIRLKELPLDPDAYVILLFTDGRGLNSRKGDQSMQVLTQFPRVAWIDLREPWFRRNRNRLARKHGIPVFSATVDGLKSALRALLVAGRQLTDDEARGEADPFSGLSAEESGIETQLGDAVLWAADCAQLQPCSLALAERLRLEFHTDLPTTRIQRLFRLKGTVRESVGFTFGTSDLGTLHDIWLDRRPCYGVSEQGLASQDSVLDFILTQVEAAEPVTANAESAPDTSSLARLTWESAREWVQFSLNRHNDLQRFAEVQQTPSGGWLDRQLSRVSTTGRNPGRPVRMRNPVDNRAARHRLARLAPETGVSSPSDDAARRQRLQVVLSTTAVWLISAFAVWITAAPVDPDVWAVEGPSSESLALWGRPKDEQAFREMGTWNQNWTATTPQRQAAWEYAVSLGGVQSSTTGNGLRELTTGRSVDSAATAKITLAETSDATYSLVEIRPGTFRMGSPPLRAPRPGGSPSPPSEVGRSDDETQYDVTLTEVFLLGQTEVTQRLYQEVMGENPSRFDKSGLDSPVENVSWEQAMEFCAKLTDRERLSGRLPDDWEYTLPTEAQWEYACRAGTETTWSFGSDSEQLELGDYAWFQDNAEMKTHPVAGKKPNSWGLYDMHGNVFEWCRDRVEGGTLPDNGSDAVTDPVGTEGSLRVIRGGSWFVSTVLCRSASRSWDVPSLRSNDVGFRVAAVQSNPASPSETEGRRRAMVWIPPGTFQMGSPENEDGRNDDETQHEVTLTQGFYLGETEVTQRQYQEVMEDNPSHFKDSGANAPVENVSWDDAMAFCEKLTAQAHASGELPNEWKYTLPTEAQWEYSCRAGNNARFSFEDDVALSPKAQQHTTDNPTQLQAIHTNRRDFRIPFRVETEEINRLGALEVQLYGSQDQGSTWALLKSVNPQDGRFSFSAPSDGEYWFAIKTVDRDGELHPDGTPAPELVVVVNTTPQFPQLSDHAWFNENSASKTHHVAKKTPNVWGLYDMHGNVWEWCRDSWDSKAYAPSPATNPIGTGGAGWVARGGSCFASGLDSRSARRGWFGGLVKRSRALGFRVVAVQSSPDNGSDTKGRRPAIWESMVLIEAGTFQMGSPADEKERHSDETQHAVTLTNDFKLCRYEVTQRQYQEVMGENPSDFDESGLDAPVENVTWEDAMEFCRQLTERERVAGQLPDRWEYTLPTEAQWEYACRAGTSTPYSFGEDSRQLGDHAWFENNADGNTHRVGLKQPNPWGLYDMHGNVWEWCRDSVEFYGTLTLKDHGSVAVTDPLGEAGSNRVIRGGSWLNTANLCRSADRYWSVPLGRGGYLGFRVAAVQSRPVASE